MTAVYDDLDPNYAAICSEATLQSNVKGFFKPFVDHVTERAEHDGWLTDVLGKLNGDKAKLAAVLQNKELMETINETLSYVKPIYRVKSGPVSKDKRQDAQLALRNGELQKALALCSQAIIRAPMPGDNEQVDGGLSLAFGLWTRSEVLMKMEKYELALRDLKLALKERLPAKQRGEYYWRMGNCYKGAGELTKAKVSYDLALRLISSKAEAKSRLEVDMDELKKVKAAKPKIEVDSEIPLAAGAKLNVPSLSKLVKISEEKDKGRFAVAGDSIKTGDVLLVEQPYAACLLPEYFGSHCCNCFTRLVAPVWCPRCSGVAFCSPECRETALSKYHSFECSFSDLFVGSGMSILSHIALRMITQVGLDTALCIHSKHIFNDSKTIEGTALNDIEGTVRTSKFNKSRKEKLSRGKKNTNILEKNTEENVKKLECKIEDNLELKAAQIYSLCTHCELRNPRDFLQRILMALFLVNCLKKTTFFQIGEIKYDKAVQSMTELLLRNLQLLQFNAHEVYETVRTTKHKFNGAKACYIAVAIYPTAALFNHECYPAVGRYFDGTKIILRAIRPLRPGETIAENYGPQFLVRTKSDRQRALACRYWFKCECRACKQNWPTLKQMDDGTEPYIKCGNNDCEGGIRSIRKEGRCSWPICCPLCGCNLLQSEMTVKWNAVKKCIEEYQAAARRMQAEEVCEAIDCLCSSLDVFHDFGSPPHRETHLAQEALRSCFADFGNVNFTTIS